MSNYWDFYCVTCQRKAGVFHWNHGESALSVIRNHLSVIAALAPLGELAQFEGLCFYGSEQRGSIIDFAAEHHTHDIRVRSEYGEFFPDDDSVEITINGWKMHVGPAPLSYERILEILEKSPDVLHTVTWAVVGKREGGTLAPGELVMARAGLVINAVVTGGA